MAPGYLKVRRVAAAVAVLLAAAVVPGATQAAPPGSISGDLGKAEHTCGPAAVAYVHVRTASRARRAMLCLLNAERRNVGLPPLREDPRLDREATEHADDMLEHRSQSAIGSDGSTPQTRALRVGYKPMYLFEWYWFADAEDLGSLPAAAVGSWVVNRARGNMLDKRIDDVGIGLGFGKDPRPDTALGVFVGVFGTEARFGVTAVRLGPGAIPVLRDVQRASTPERMPAGGCEDGITAGSEWLDCGPHGEPDQAWPVIVSPGGRLALDRAVFKAPTVKEAHLVDGTTLVGDADLAGAASGFHHHYHLTLTKPGVSAGGVHIVADHIAADRPLPDLTGPFELTIRWHFQFPHGDQLPVGASRLRLYLLGGSHSGGAERALSVVDLAARAAAERAGGSTSPESDRTAIWDAFKTLSIRRTELDPRTGETRPGSRDLRYWRPWNPRLEIAEKYAVPRTCPAGGTLALLKDDDYGGRCGLWAQFLRDTLNAAGVKPGRAISVSQMDGYVVPARATVMLIKPWGVGPAPAAGASHDRSYPLSIEFLCGLPRPVVREELTYTGDPVSGIGQGHVGRGFPSAPGPKGWFAAGDHDVLEMGPRDYLDPSYGNQYSGWTDFVRKAVAGWGYFQGSHAGADGSSVCSLNAFLYPASS
jgi:uncharacterized protein YkwD